MLNRADWIMIRKIKKTKGATCGRLPRRKAVRNVWWAVQESNLRPPD